jgi:uncharacterized RDD family membrane protein YckC
LRLGFRFGIDNQLTILLILLGIPLALILFYNALLDSSELQGAIGKLALRIKAVNKEGKKISVGQVFARAAMKSTLPRVFGFVLFIGGLIGFVYFVVQAVLILVNDKNQSTHDLASQAFVVKR